jgi:putative cell wall-binding protein
MKKTLMLLMFAAALGACAAVAAPEKLRVIVTSDAEIDDQCSMVRFLLYANEWDIEGIITTSSSCFNHPYDPPNH